MVRIPRCYHDYSGIKIHYSLQSNVTSPEEARRPVEALRQHALEMLGGDDPHCVDDELCEAIGVPFESGPLGGRVLRKAAREGRSVDLSAQGVQLPAGHAFYFTASPSWVVLNLFSFGLCRYAKRTPEVDASPIVHPEWTWDDWVITCQRDVAPESNPQVWSKRPMQACLREHLSVVGILDYAEDLGILGDVVDETGFYEHRNLDTLIEVFTRCNPRMAMYEGKLDDLLAAGFFAGIISRRGSDRGSARPRNATEAD